MKILLSVFSIIIFTMSAFSQTPSLAGTYSSQTANGKIVLTLNGKGNLTGQMLDDNGDIYPLEGVEENGLVKGKLQTAIGIPVYFEAGMQGKDLIFSIIPLSLFQKPLYDQAQKIVMQKAGASAQTAGTGKTTQVQTPSTPKPQIASSELDARLIGSWEHTETYISGTFSSVSQFFMHLKADGAFLYGNGRVMAGGDNAFGSASADTGNSGDYERGFWKAKGGVIYVMEEGGNQWYPYSGYYIEGTTLMLKFDNGSKQIWYKQ
ncbi:MAG: hypothetical protein R3D00_11945 [Bacteroidia bacterium]